MPARPPLDTTRDVAALNVVLSGYALFVSSEAGVFGHVIEDRSVVVGRGQECDVRIEDSSISRRHAVVHRGDPPLIEDLGSRNGTRVRGSPLVPGQRIPLPVGTV